jgi:hypothetical protein
VSFLYVWILQGPFYGKLWIGNLEHASLVDITTDIGRRGKKTSLLGGTNMTGPQCACKASSSSTFSTLYKPKGAVDAADTRPCFYSDSQNPRLADQLSHKCHTWCDRKARGLPALSNTELQDLGKECLAYEGTSRVVYLIGDSHAAMMADSIKEAVKGKYVVRSWTTGCYCGFGIMCEHPEQDRPEIAPNDVERQNIRLQAGMKADACSTFLHMNLSMAMKPAFWQRFSLLGMVRRNCVANIYLSAANAQVLQRDLVQKTMTQLYEYNQDSHLEYTRPTLDLYWQQKYWGYLTKGMSQEELADFEKAKDTL